MTTARAIPDSDKPHKVAPDYEGDCWCHPILGYQDRQPYWIHLDERIVLIPDKD